MEFGFDRCVPEAENDYDVIIVNAGALSELP